MVQNREGLQDAKGTDQGGWLDLVTTTMEYYRWLRG